MQAALRAPCLCLQRVLTKQELDYLERAQHRPTAVTQVLQPATNRRNVACSRLHALCTCTLTLLTVPAKLA